MLKKLIFVPLIALGVLAFVLLVRSRKELPKRDLEERTPVVRVLTVPRTTVVPRALGYGEVRAESVWQAVPQVGGRIIEVSEKVREGSFASRDTVLLRIDRADYDLAIARAEARVAALEAEHRENATRSETIETSLAIERSSLAYATTELERAKRLVEDGTLAPAELDLEQRTVLAQKLRVQEIENTQELLIPQRDVVAAQLRQERSNVERARLDVERTVIRAPFDCRIGPVRLEKDQVVQAGQLLFSAEDTSASEVTAWLPPQGVRHVLAVGTAGMEALTGIEEVPARLGLTATIRATIGTLTATWPAEVVRIRGVDSRTRAIGIDVRVQDPYEGVIPGTRPPLVPGLYVEVEVRARPAPAQVVVPRSALHDSHVRLVDADGRLELREVDVRFVQGEHAIVSAGLEGGETLVLSDVVPAVSGLRVTAVPDADALRVLIEDAAGDAAASKAQGR